MHIGITGYPGKDYLFPVFDQIKFGHGAVLGDKLGYTFVRTFVFVFCEPFGELAHVFHRNFFAGLGTVDAPRDIAEFPIAETDERVGYGFYLGKLCQMHCQVFQFGKEGVIVCLRFQYKTSPEPDNGKSFGSTAHLVKVEGKFRLNACQCSLGAYHLLCQFSDFFSFVRQYGDLGCAEYFTAASGMEVCFPVGKGFVTK